MLERRVITSLTLTSDSMRARDMSERTALSVSVVTASDVDWSFWREERSLPPSSASTMVKFDLRLTSLKESTLSSSFLSVFEYHR